MRNSILISNDSNVSATRLFAYGNIMYFGYLVEKQLKLFLIEFKKFVKPIENQITTMNWDINLNLVIAY